jgi:hypothetical protein
MEGSSKVPPHVPFLFVATNFLANASCSSACDCRCFSLFCSMSSCDLSPRMAFLGLSFLFCEAAPPPNQPQTPDIFTLFLFPGLGIWAASRVGGLCSSIDISRVSTATSVMLEMGQID